MHIPLISFLTDLWHLLDVSAVAGHAAVFAAHLFYFILLLFFIIIIIIDNVFNVGF